MIKNVSVYVIASVTNALFPFLIIPILTRELTSLEYGQIAMFQMLVNGLLAIVGFCTLGATNRKYFEKGTTEELTKSYNNSCVVLAFLSFILVCLIIAPMEEQVSSGLGIPQDWLYISSMIALLMYMVNLRLGQWQVRGLSKKYATLQVSNGLFISLATVLFVVTLDMGSDGRVWAQLLILVGFGFFSLVSLVKDDLLSARNTNLKDMSDALKFGLPLVPHNISLFIISSLDRVVINEVIGLSAAGEYMVAFQLSSAISIVLTAINKAYMPWLFRELERADGGIRVVKLTYGMLATLFILGAFSAIFSGWFSTLVVGSSYQGVQEVIGWLCIGHFFGGGYLIVTNYIFYAKKTKYLAYVTVFTGIVGLVLMYYLIKEFGLVGAGISFAISKMIQFFLTWYISNKVHPMPWLISVNKECERGK